MQHETPATRICTVSTVKDSAANLAAFVQRNLAAGADHMFLFVDDADAEVVRALDAVPHVTAVPTGAGYWRKQRPGQLNNRQNVNANLVNVALSVVATPTWLMHIDSDECLDLDRDQLLALPPDVDSVRLGTHECLSKLHWDGVPDRFKRQLDRHELHLLHALGVIARPKQLEYFRGHVHKPGLRPRLDRRLRIHNVDDLHRERLTSFQADWLRVLHFESPSGEEFIRKWMAQLGSGGATYRADRDALRSAIVAVVDNPVLDADAKHELLLRIYEARVRDDEATLERLGYLVTPCQEWHRHRPESLPAEDLAVAADLLHRGRAADKAYFEVGPRQRPPRDWLTEVRAELGRDDRRLRRRLDSVLDEA